MSVFSLLYLVAISHAAPVPHPVAYSDCAKFDIDGAAEDASSAKEKATAYLNGALDRVEDNDKGSASSAEMKERDSCVELALKNGANPNNSSDYEAPLLMALEDGDAAAFKILLNYHANPNVKAQLTKADPGVTVLSRACSTGNDDFAVSLLSAGVDPNDGQPMWECSAQGEDRAVAAFLQTGKVPVNQLSAFADPSFGDDRETALDASEQRVNALKDYQTKNAATSKQDKINAASELIYTYYVGRAQLSAKDYPAEVISGLLQKQSHISELLKAAGWVCHQKNCGIPEN